ncbi:MAG: hypothetical protein A3D89_04250 [Planctomycetes bacterium RIFCSPHIGHO2_02_FULL_52_58]|nr:MAG: hypothetical protein A3D89_04250 [Planctomycetes bacterium RIFCSPHIGHO2_02_FULL_52_58]
MRREEMETIINFASNPGSHGYIHTTQPEVRKKLEKMRSFVQVGEGEFKFLASFLRWTKTGLHIGPPRKRRGLPVKPSQVVEELS